MPAAIGMRLGLRFSREVDVCDIDLRHLGMSVFLECLCRGDPFTWAGNRALAARYFVKDKGDVTEADARRVQRILSGMDDADRATASVAPPTAGSTAGPGPRSSSVGASTPAGRFQEYPATPESRVQRPVGVAIPSPARSSCFTTRTGDSRHS
jgi:hypothetical protein